MVAIRNSRRARSLHQRAKQNSAVVVSLEDWIELLTQLKDPAVASRTMTSGSINLTVSERLGAVLKQNEDRVVFSWKEWTAFLSGARANEFDLFLGLYFPSNSRYLGVDVDVYYDDNA